MHFELSVLFFSVLYKDLYKWPGDTHPASRIRYICMSRFEIDDFCVPEIYKTLSLHLKGNLFGEIDFLINVSH